MGLLPSVVVAAALAGVVWSVLRVGVALREAREQADRARSLRLLTLFAPGLAAAADDPRALLVWHPLATTARRLFPEVFASLDAAAGRPFPFSPTDVEQAHAQWTADWLAWEQAHDNTYKLKAAQAEAEMPGGLGSFGRARLDSIEREKLERYQVRYGQYVRTAKALQALIAPR